MEITLAIVKPHAVSRGLVGEFLARFERMGLRILAARVIKEGEVDWEKFYPSDDLWLSAVGSKTLDDCKNRGVSVRDKLGTEDPQQIGRMVKSWLVAHMNSSQAFAVILHGNDAASKVRRACGKTLPNQADPGTIRFDYSSDSPSLANDERRPVFNLIHASDPSETRDGRSAVEYESSLIFPQLGI